MSIEFQARKLSDQEFYDLADFIVSDGKGRCDPDAAEQAIRSIAKWLSVNTAEYDNT